jgi:phosphate transport system ATP-binding protein
MNDFVSNTRVSGDVRVGEKNVYDRSIDVTELRQQVGMISQKPNVVPMSIYDNVALGLRLRGVADKSTLDATVFKALEDAGLWEEVKDRLGSPAMALSGGQQQRLCIARAIALNPQILLMDEPCSALDPISTKVVEQLIQNLKRKFTIVIVTHNMQQARRVSDHTAMFYEGRMAEAAPTEQFFGNPQSETAQKYLAGHFS